MGLYLLLKILVKNISKNASKSLKGKYSQKLLDHAEKSPTDVRKTSSKRVIQKKGESSGDLIGNKIANNITKVSGNLQQNYLDKVINENDKEIPKERHMSPEKRKKVIDDLRLE